MRSLNGVIAVLMVVLLVPPIIGGGLGIMRTQHALVAARAGTDARRTQVSALIALSLRLERYQVALQETRERPDSSATARVNRAAQNASGAFADLGTRAVPVGSRPRLRGAQVLVVRASGAASSTEAARMVRAAQEDVFDVLQRRNEEPDARLTALTRMLRAGANNTLVGAALTVLVAIGIASWLRRALHQPLQGLLRATQRLASGDLSGNVPASGLSEFRPIVAAFNDMAGQLRRDRLTLTQLAYHDALTGLPNRGRFLHRVDDRLRATGWAHVLFIDVDDFKAINDAHGHAVGDAVLVEVAARLARALSGGDVVARLGGDEFAILVGGGDDGAAAMVAQRAQQAFLAPFWCAGLELRVTASIGLADTDGISTTTALLERADVAMYRAKSAGKNRNVAYRHLSAA